MSNELVDDPVFRYRLRFAPQEGDALRIDIWVDAGGGVSIPHYHPVVRESFEVLEGEITFTVDGEKHRRGPGETIVAEPGMRHAFENTGDVETHMTVDAEPALDLKANLEEGAALARAGTYTRRGIPKGPRKLLRAVEFMDRYRETTVITTPMLPPPRFQPALLGPLARLERRLQARRGR
jgi:quercetin dioxygenase-like cupin family protein